MLAIITISLGILLLILIVIPNSPKKIQLTASIMKHIPSKFLSTRIIRIGMLPRRVWIGVVLLLFAIGLYSISSGIARGFAIFFTIIGLSEWLIQWKRNKAISARKG